MNRVSPVLFLNDDGMPLEFSLRGLSSESSLVVFLIKAGGGIIHVKRDGPHTIVLDKPESRIFGEEEYFNCNYVADCCEENVLVDLSKYRLNKNSKYVEDYDANLILLKKKSWKDVPLKSVQKSDDEEETDVQEATSTWEPTDEVFSKKPVNLRTLARPYSERERIAIITWIIKNKSYSSIGGNSLWKEMEENEVCEGRTWQSLKEHFKKKILPSINKFGLSKEQVRCFKARRSHFAEKSD